MGTGHTQESEIASLLYVYYSFTASKRDIKLRIRIRTTYLMMLTISTSILCRHPDIKGLSTDCKCFQGDDSIGIYSFSHMVGGLVELHWNRYYVNIGNNGG